MSMNVHRTAWRIAAFSVAAVACATLSPSAAAQNYPARPVRVVTPSAQGGNADILTRIVAEGLAKNLGQPFLTDNRAGASGTIGTQFVAKAPADGYTLLFISSTHAVNPALFDLPYDTQKDFTGISEVGATPVVMVAYPGMGVATLKELIARAKAAPGQINFASGGTGTPAHLAGELLNSMAGIRMTHIPYKAAPQTITDTMSGQVQIAFPSLPSVLSMVSAGKLRALGITSLARSPVAPDIPTMAEAVPGYQASIWTGMLAAAATPRPIVARLNGEIIKVLDAAPVRAKLAAMGVEVKTGTPEEFTAFIDSEVKKWTRIVKEGNIKLEAER